jgi:hypothetical protein
MLTIPSAYVIIVSTAVWLSLIVFYLWGRHKYDEEAIENTILYLASEGYLKYTRDENGEIEIHKIDTKK